MRNPLKYILLTALLILAYCLVGAVQAEESYGPYKADLDYVYDGDSIKMYVHTEIDHQAHVMIRLKGWDTPELHPHVKSILKKHPELTEGDITCQIPMAKAAAAFTKQWAANASSFTLSDVTQDDFPHRWDANIQAIINGTTQDLGKVLQAHGLARPEQIGNSGIGWCKAPCTLNRRHCNGR